MVMSQNGQVTSPPKPLGHTPSGGPEIWPLSHWMVTGWLTPKCRSVIPTLKFLRANFWHDNRRPPNTGDSLAQTEATFEFTDTEPHILYCAYGQLELPALSMQWTNDNGAFATNTQEIQAHLIEDQPQLFENNGPNAASHRTVSSHRPRQFSYSCDGLTRTCTPAVSRRNPNPWIDRKGNPILSSGQHKVRIQQVNDPMTVEFSSDSHTSIHGSASLNNSVEYGFTGSIHEGDTLDLTLTLSDPADTVLASSFHAASDENVISPHTGATGAISLEQESAINSTDRSYVLEYVPPHQFPSLLQDSLEHLSFTALDRDSNAINIVSTWRSFAWTTTHVH